MLLKPDELTAVSPLDGRYREKVNELSEFVSEFALIKARVGIEIKYLVSLSKIGIVNLSGTEKKKLLRVIKDFGLKEAEKVKRIEDKIKHDVKAVEIYLRSIIGGASSDMIHFGLTSEDINNIAYRIMLRSASENVMTPTLELLISELRLLSKKYKDLPMLGRTHGQPAVPTTLGKEIAVFSSRLESEIEKLNKIKLTAKLNGAVGNYNALVFTYPKINWVKFSKNFIESLGFEPELVTTQVNPSEDIIEYFQVLQRINGIILNLNQDFWRYISDGWLIHSTEKNQIGSSTMPQKINPIDFENSEGNLELTNGLIEVFSRKLPVSRLQRDLSGSTIVRNAGVILAHSLLAYKGTLSGLSKLGVNKAQILKDLNEDWSILAEALQTVLRLEGYRDSYSKVISFTKGKHLSEQGWQNLVQDLKISKKNKDKLLSLTPQAYLGLAAKLASK